MRDLKPVPQRRVTGTPRPAILALKRHVEGGFVPDPPEFSGLTEDLKQSEQITLVAWRQRPLWEKIKESFFVLFRMRL